jgi:Xaa-Pro aminopeptidase
MRKKGLPDELVKIARRCRMDQIGFVADHVTVAMLGLLRKALRPVAARLVRVDNVASDLRLRKDAREIDLIRQAVRIAEEAFLAFRRTIRLGQTEAELAARLNYEMGRRGASGPSFPIVVAEGPNSARPHAEPGKRVVKPGSAVLFDWGATYRGYCSDLTRVLFAGKITRRFQKVYDIVLEAQQQAIRGLSAGRIISEIDGIARSHITKRDHGKQFGHALGHGVGLDIHESPGVNARNRARLEAGMVITIEPGIYVPGMGGVRIEDDVLITENGCEVLSVLPKDLDWAVLDV